LDLRGRKWREAGEDCVMRSHNLYPSPDIIGIIKSRRIRREGHVVHMREIRNAHKILVGNTEGKR
jgi:hypothetical protein